MHIGPVIINWMGYSNPSIRVWLDVKLRSWWYVFLWRKGKHPYMYRSKDATPPNEDNKGYIFFGNPYYD